MDKQSDSYTEFVKDTGAERERLGFRREVLAVFTPLLEPYGFACVSADPYIVKFESSQRYVIISHEPGDYEINLQLGRLPYKLSSGRSLVDILKKRGINGLPGYAAVTEEQVKRRVRQIAELVKDHCMDVLIGSTKPHSDEAGQ